jgi:hypothetical protein
MKNILIACGIALAAAAPAQANIPEKSAEPADLTCVRLHMTAYVPNLVSEQPFACCGDGHACPGYLSITPAPIPHTDLKT